MSTKKKHSKHTVHTEAKENSIRKNPIHKDKRFIIGAVIAILIILFIVFRVINSGSSQEGSGTQSGADVVALVNGEEITDKDVNEIYQAIALQNPQASVDEALNQTIYMEILAQEAAKKGIVVNQIEIDQLFEQQLAVLMQQVDEAQLQQSLAQNGMTFEEFKQKARESLYIDQLILKLLQEEVYNKIPDISDEEARNIYNQQVALMPTQTITASHIIVCYQGATRCEESYTKEEALTKIEEVAGQFNGTNFAVLAQEHSTGPSAPSGGQLGTFSKGQMVASFENAAFALDVNELSAPVETEFGYHIILVTDKEEREVPTFEETKANIKEQEKLRQSQQYQAVYLEELWRNADIQFMK